MTSPQSKNLISRRTFLRLAKHALVVAGAGGFASVYAWNIEPNNLVVENVPVRLSRLPKTLNGLTVGFLSDLHIFAPVSPEHIARAVQMLMQRNPDLVVLGGDYVTGSADAASSCADVLAQLRAPLGVYALLGNHDYWVGNTQHIVAQFTRVGIRVLRNESVKLGNETERFYLVGLDDVWEEHVDLSVLANIPADACTIVAVHEPDFATELAKLGIDLQISGHSHGGQVRLPFIGAPQLPYLGTKYPIGLQRVGEFTQIYTSRGVGMIYPAVRFNCPPEVTVLKLQSSI
ncbi:MAG: metallophosphoesterase [Chloroflexi bacterium]|nr:metallophosphoesterase [Chloroflexota bacterium]